MNTFGCVTCSKLITFSIVVTTFVTACAEPDRLRASVVPQSSPAPNIATGHERDITVAELFRLAKSRDAARLAVVARSLNPSDPAVSLAMYAIDPIENRTRFVDEYPIDDDGINGDYGARLAKSHLFKTGTSFPIDQLAKLAAHQNPVAAHRLLVAQANASNDLASIYDRDASRMLSHTPPAFALTVLADLPVQIQLVSVAEANWCGDKPKRLLAFEPTPIPESTGASPSPAPTPPQRAARELVRQSFGACTLAAVERRIADRGQRKEARRHARPAKKKRTAKAT